MAAFFLFDPASSDYAIVGKSTAPRLAYTDDLDKKNFALLICRLYGLGKYRSPFFLDPLYPLFRINF